MTSQAQIRRYANMVAGRALNDVLNMASYDGLNERFPDADLREEVVNEVMKLASRLIHGGDHPPKQGASQ